MTRMVRDWKAVRVDQTPTAPHRYTWDFEMPVSTYKADSVDALIKATRAFREMIPYKVGEVVWVERDGQAVRALVHQVHIGRDLCGDPREFYRVQYETQNGVFAKMWSQVWPGHVQRGYKLAGLAPDVQEEAAQM